jgi:hypothetical protein
MYCRVPSALLIISLKKKNIIVCVILVSFLPRILIFILQYFPNVLAGKIAVYACAAEDDRSLTVGRAGAAGGSSYLA